jgi:hypothetical protein
METMGLGYVDIMKMPISRRKAFVEVKFEKLWREQKELERLRRK